MPPAEPESDRDSRSPWTEARPIVAWLLFVRFSLLIAALLVFFPFIATGPAAGLLGNLFVLDFGGLVIVSALTLTTAWVVVLTAQTGSMSGPLRLLPPQIDGDSPEGGPGATRCGHGIRLTWNPDGTAASALRAWRHQIAAALACPMVAVALISSCDGGANQPSPASSTKVLAVLVGAALVYAVLLTAGWMERWFAPVNSQDFGFLLPVIARVGARAQNRRPPAWVQALRRLVIRVLSLPTFGSGYLKNEQELRPGHATALSFSFLTTLAYFAIGLLNNPAWFQPRTPALAYLLILAMLLGWILSALSFWLDRFRLPVALLLVAASAISFTAAGDDHYFRLLDVNALASEAGEDTSIERGGDGRAPGEDESALIARLSQPCDQPVVVVAAAGGGITSAAWTAAILTRLAEDPESGGQFLRALRLISGVSGGSVGAMFFVDGMPKLQKNVASALDPSLADGIRRAAAASSLEFVGWGLAYPDLMRGIFSPAVTTLSPWIDRSWALEKSWEARLSGSPRSAPTLRQWRELALTGAKPIVVFNSTSVETGDRFQFATLRLGAQPGRAGFWETYPGYDLAVTTAARLSATFPFVSTAARARTCCRSAKPEAHFVDGGYYENSGVMSATELLDQALERTKGSACRPPVVLLRLEAFDSDLPPLAKVEAGNGWATSLASPVEALYRVRTSTQVYRNDWELGLFCQKWRDRGYEIGVVDVPLHGLGPLSWRLTRREVAQIEAVASDAILNAAVRRLHQLLVGQRGVFTREAEAPRVEQEGGYPE